MGLWDYGTGKAKAGGARAGFPEEKKPLMNASQR
jgi:hypothetical protein